MQAFPFDSELTFDEHDNPIYDRAVSSQPLRQLIRELFTTGVMPNPSTNFQVSAGTDGMTVHVAAGFAVIDGGLCKEDETRTLSVTAADNTYDRIDTVVLRWNENVNVRTADLYILAGTPSSNPVRPTLTRNNSIYEIGLADVFVTKRVATITSDKITDTRYESARCGIVSSVSEWDTTTIYQQIQSELEWFKGNEEQEFNAWFANVVDQLSTDAAGNLLNLINDINDKLYLNFLDPSLYTMQSMTSHGLTFTVDKKEGTITVNGTSDNDVGTDGYISFNVTEWGAMTELCNGYSSVKLTGCPSGYGEDIRLQVADENPSTRVWTGDKGNGAILALGDNILRLYVLRVSVKPNVTLDNVVFKPMITDNLEASYDDFIPFSGNGKINKNVADIAVELKNKVTVNGAPINSIDFTLVGDSLHITTT